jgi:23S rRNA (uracil1939-C5)-methyltransferase
MGRPEGSSESATAQRLHVRAVGGQGDGVAEGPVFVPFTLPGETVDVRRHGQRADLVAVVEASPGRVEPPCPHFFACGGCALQHWAAEPYLGWKAEQVRITLAAAGLEPELLPTFASPPGSRRRIGLHARKAGREVRLGYKERRSWSLVDIAVCPIADPRLTAALPQLRRLAAPLFEHPKSAPSLHCTWTETGLDVDITGVERKSGGLSADARMRVAEAAGEGDLARVTLAGEILFQARQPLVRFGAATVALPPGSFLQAVPAAEAAMAGFAVQALAGARRIADLFCGVGTFTFRLAEIAPTHGVDGETAAIRALLAATGGAPGLKAVTAEARDLFRRPFGAAELKSFDAVVFDPPRAGAEAQAAQIAAAKGVTRVVGVSCAPSTFARDARILCDAGFRLEQVLPVDQFLWSPHVELVGVFSR